MLVLRTVGPCTGHSTGCPWGGQVLHTCTARAQEETASCASPANTRGSTQRYSLDRHSSVCCTGGYHVAYAAAALSRCASGAKP